MKRLGVTIFLFLLSSNPLFGEGHSLGLEKNTVTGLDLRDCRVILIFERVWKYSPLVEKERAVWIVRNGTGEYRAIDWLHTPERNIASWSGLIPDGVVAQAHTHGDHLNPKPSMQDVSTARRLGIPVYTLTRKGVWRAAPDGSITEVLSRGWFKRPVSSCSRR